MAQSGHSNDANQCPLLAVKQTLGLTIFEAGCVPFLTRRPVVSCDASSSLCSAAVLTEIGSMG